MKTNKLYWGTLAVALGFTACTNEITEIITTPEGAVRFTSEINLGTKVNEKGDAWTGGEKVGIYMVGENAFTPISGADNKEYTAASTGELTPTDNIQLFYPTTGDKVKFVAYYPYSATVTNNIYKVDLSAAGEHDLLYAAPAEAYDKTNKQPVSLAFTHQMAKLTLNVKSDTGADATGVTANITRNTTADFDLATGTLAAPAGSKTLAMTATDAKLEAIIMPGTDATSEIVFTYEGKNYTWDISAVEFAAGNQYSYTINLKAQAAADVQASLNSTIQGWGLVSNSQDISRDVTYKGATFAGTLNQGEAIAADAKITVNYTDGNGSIQTFTTVAKGLAGTGVVVEDKQVTVATGDGSVELPVTGTPNIAGDITFSIMVNGKEVATATAKVTPVTPTPAHTSAIELLNIDKANKAYPIELTIETTNYPGVKMGTSSVAGTWTTPAIGAGKTKISFYAIAWGGKNGKLTVTINNGGSFADGQTTKTIDIAGKEGVGGSATVFPITVATSDLFVDGLKDITDVTTLTFTSSKKENGLDARAIIWGINF